MQVQNYLSTKLLSLILLVGCGIVMLVSCSNDDDIQPVSGFEEKQPTTIHYPNCEVEYIGDDIGEQTSDGWLIKFYTDMSTNDMGLLEGPGSVLQLLLNVTYADNQTPNLDNLVGQYLSQSNSGDFSANTFVYGYMDYIDLPGGRIERADATFFGDIPAGKTEESMEVDLLDDGMIEVKSNGDGTYTIEGILVGKKCAKRIFTWSGEITPSSRVEPELSNSTIKGNLTLNNLTKCVLEDRGDYFFLGDSSCRDFMIFLGDDGIDLSTGRPQGTGDVLRLELLVPWDTDKEAGIPAGSYPMITRNEDTSFDKESIVPFRSVAGLPDRFSYPYWAGTWYVDFVDGGWGSSYARIDRGTVTVSRDEDGNHRFVCNFEDCSNPSKTITCDVTITNENFKVMKYF